MDAAADTGVNFCRIVRRFEQVAWRHFQKILARIQNFHGQAGRIVA